MSEPVAIKNGVTAKSLTLRERFVILRIIPVNGDIKYIRTAKALQDLMSPTDEETDGWGVVKNVENGTLSWPDDTATATSLDFTPRMVTCIEDALGQLDKDRQLGIDHLSIWEKFMEEQGGGAGDQVPEPPTPINKAAAAEG